MTNDKDLGIKEAVADYADMPKLTWVIRQQRKTIKKLGRLLQDSLRSERASRQLVIGALDSMGVALAEHGHGWSEGERAIYEMAIQDLTKDDENTTTEN